MLTREHRSLRELALWHRFHVRLTALYGVVVFTALAIIGVLFYRSSFDAELQGLRDRLLATAITLAATLDPETLAQLDSVDDLEDAGYQKVWDQLTAIIERYPSITSIYAMRPSEQPGRLITLIDVIPRTDSGHLLPGEPYDASSLPVFLRGLEEPAVEERPWRDEFGLTISGYAPILGSGGEPMGIVGVDLDARRLDTIKREVLLTTTAVFGLAAVLLGGLAVVVARSLREPLVRFMAASSEVADGNFKARVDLERRDEFGLLGKDFNHMAEGLEEREFIRETFGRYVSEDVARTVLASPEMVELGGEERDVTVLLSDIQGYSTISEELSPTQVVSLLNEYLGAMNAVIDAHQGCVIEYIGDAILAVFGAPNPLADHAERAVRCALAMRARLLELNREWEASGLSKLWQGKGYPELGQRIGIHSGPVVAGNLGSQTRMKYAVTGDTVNVASRLETLNHELKTEILLSHSVFDKLPGELRDQLVDRGEHSVKGRTGQIHVYSL